MSENTKAITVRTDDETRQLLKIMAEKEYRTQSNLIKYLLKKRGRFPLS